LAGFKARVGLVDDINAALATDQLVVAMALHQALKGIANFHDYTYMGGRNPPCSKSALCLAVQQGPVNHTKQKPGKMQNILCCLEPLEVAWAWHFTTVARVNP
jgi:hypothetical protein